jgi:DNA-directed RNA polymerase specialized sigma24 family protein
MKLDDMDNYEIAEAIDRYVRGERARAILKRRLLDEICYEPLAEEFEISVSQLKRILSKAQEQLFKHLERR